MIKHSNNKYIMHKRDMMLVAMSLVSGPSKLNFGYPLRAPLTWFKSRYRDHKVSASLEAHDPR